MRVKYVFLVYINLMLVFMLSKICLRIQGFNYITVTLVFLSAIFIHLIYVKILKKSVFIFSFTCLLVGGLTAYYLNNTQIIYNYLQIVNDNLIDAGGIIYNGTNLEFFKVSIIYYLLAVLITIVTMIMYERQFSNFILIATLAIVITLWYWNYKDKLLVYMPVYILVTTISYALNKHYSNMRKLSCSGVKTIGGLINIVYMVIAVLLVTSIGYIIPKEHVGKYNDEIFVRLNEQKDKKQTNDSIDENTIKNYAFSGINNISKNNSTQIGGPVKLDNTTLFYVKADKPLYLKGVNKEVYDGQKWSTADYREYGYVSSSGINLEGLYSEKKSDPYYLLTLQMESVEKRGAVEKELEIIPAKGLNNKVIFTPYFTKAVLARNGTKSNLKVNYDGCFADESTAKGYSVHYYTDKNGIELFENAHKLGIGNNKSLDDIMNYYYDNYTNTTTQDKIADMETYITVSDKVPKSVIDLTMEITKGSKDNPEKVEKILQYLKTNYTYSLDVSDSGGEEVVSNFLFKQKKGYCVYFATAMTIMCRIAGVPARYAEGIKMTDRKNSDGLYEVTNADAHAWAEVLISPETNLWCIADATPSSSAGVSSSSQNSGQNSNAVTNVNKQNNSPQFRDTKTKKMDISNKTKGLNFAIKITPKIIGVIIMFLFIILIVLRIFLYISKRNKVLNAVSIIPLYEFTVSRLKTIGYIKPLSMGYMEFASSIDEEELKLEMSRITKCVYDEAYGKKSDSSFDKMSFYRFLERYVKKDQNNLMYYLKKLV